MTTVLVTGGTGFVGTPLVAALQRRGASVVAAGSAAGDLLATGTAAALCERADASHLVHLAWCATPPTFYETEENDAWVDATAELVDAFVAAGGQRVLLAGSVAEYGPDGGVCDERTTALAPTTRYGAAKLQAWQALSGRNDVASTEGRIFQLYGPGEHPERLLPHVITSLLDGREAACTPGEQRLDFVHVADAADALAALALSEVVGPVNIGTGTATSVAEVVTRIGDQLGRGDLVRLGAIPPSGPPTCTVAATARLAGELGWTPAFDLDRGLADTIEWWRSTR